MINADQLKEFLGCDDEFLVQLMQTFLKESAESINRLKTATGTNNWPLVKATAHKILSSTRIFNIGEMSNVLEEIEKMAEKSVNVEQIPAKVQVIEQSWQTAAAEIKAFLQKQTK